MSADKIFAFGDGFAHSHIWPEWPLLLSAIYPTVEVITHTGIGAGNEFITQSIVDQFALDPNGLFIVQWSVPYRFDKLIENLSWEKIIEKDDVYSKNFVTVNNIKWWLSSSSKLQELETYHKKYIEKKQAELRTFRDIFLIKNLFENNNIDYVFCFAFEPRYFTEQQKTILSTANWAWHKDWMGINEFSLQPLYRITRQNEVQPSPIVHIDWVIETLLPKIKYAIDSKRVETLQNIIYNTEWQPFYWDRDELWNKILKQL